MGKNKYLYPSKKPSLTLKQMVEAMQNAIGEMMQIQQLILTTLKHNGMITQEKEEVINPQTKQKQIRTRWNMVMTKPMNLSTPVMNRQFEAELQCPPLNEEQMKEMDKKFTDIENDKDVDNHE